MGKAVSGRARDQALEGFHYKRNWSDLVWSVGEQVAEIWALGGFRTYEKLRGDEAEGRIIQVDGHRQGLILEATGVDSLRLPLGSEVPRDSEDAGVISTSGGKIDYWASTVAWVQGALREAGVSAEGLEQAATWIAYTSCFVQSINSPLGVFKFSAQSLVGILNSQLSVDNQKMDFRFFDAQDFICPQKTLHFEVEDGQLQGCRISVVSNTPVTYELKPTDDEQVILAETIEVSETLDLELVFGGEAGCSMRCRSIEIDVQGDSRIHSIFEPAMVHWMADRQAEVMSLPAFSQPQSFLLDLAKHYADVDEVKLITDQCLERRGIDRAGFEHEIDIYIVKLDKKVMLNGNKKKSKLTAAWRLKRYFTQPSFVRLVDLSAFQDVLSDGNLNALFRRCMGWMSSQPTDDVGVWFEEELKVALSAQCLHNRELIGKCFFITYLDDIKNRHRKSLFVVHRDLTLLHRVASYRIELLPYLLDQLKDEDRYQVLSHEGRGYSVLSIVAYGVFIDGRHLRFLEKLLQEVKKLPQEQQDAILAMPAMDGGFLKDKEVVANCLRDMEQPADRGPDPRLLAQGTARSDDSSGPGPDHTL